MFVDLVGSTALSVRLDPEDLREVIGAYQRRVAADVARFGGFVAKYMGDGVLAYFGFPQADEDDAERAVRAGLELVTAVRRARLSGRDALRARVGVATGLVVVGDLLGSGAAQEQAVVGETPNLAARLQALAEPDSVVIAAGDAPAARRSVRLRRSGRVEAKGFAGPVRAYRVLGDGTAESRFEAFHAARPGTAGRARGGARSCCCAAGSRPGAARARSSCSRASRASASRGCCAALQERLAAEPHIAARYFCSPHHQDSAFHPIIAQLERAAAIGRADPPPARLDKLDALLARTSPPAEDVALLAELLSIPSRDRHPRPRSPPSSSGSGRSRRCSRQLEGLACERRCW